MQKYIDRYSNNQTGVGLVTNYMLTLTQFGRKRANPFACHTNTMKIAEGDGPCDCPEKLPTCLHTLVIPNASTGMIALIMFNGESIDVRKPLRTPYPPDLMDTEGPFSTHTAQLKDACPYLPANDAQKVRNYLFTVSQRYELDTKVDVVLDPVADTLTIKHIGQCDFASVTLLDPADKCELKDVITADKCCQILNLTRYTIYGQGNIGNLTANGQSLPLPNGPYSFTGVTADDATTAATLATDIKAVALALGVVIIGISVMPDPASGSFKIEYDLLVQAEIYFGIKPAIFCGCFESFACNVDTDGDGDVDEDDKIEQE